MAQQYAHPKMRRFRVALRSLFAVLSVFAIAMAILANGRARFAKEQAVVANLQEVALTDIAYSATRGFFGTDERYPMPSDESQSLIQQFAAGLRGPRVVYVCLDMRIYDADLQALAIYREDVQTCLASIIEFRELRGLAFQSNQLVDLEPITRLRNLQFLNLVIEGRCNLSPLIECTELEELRLVFEGHCDLSPLKALKHLRRLELHSECAPMEQIARLRKALPDCRIVVPGRPCSELSRGAQTRPPLGA